MARRHPRLPSPPRAVVALLALAALPACAAPRQRVDVWLGADVPQIDERGRRLPGAERDALAAEMAWRVVASFPCAPDQARDDSTDCPREIRLPPIADVAGPVPDPASFTAGARGRPPASRDPQAAFEEAIRARNRAYARHAATLLATAESIEIAPADGSEAPHRVAPDAFERALGEALDRMAAEYAALEWARLEETRAARAPARRPGSRSAATAPAPAPAAERGGAAGGISASSDPDPLRDETAPPPADESEGAAGDRASPSGAAIVPVAARDDGCRRACTLLFRTCLAGCRDRPVEGGDYDACAYGCDAETDACRAGCHVAPPP